MCARALVWKFGNVFCLAPTCQVLRHKAVEKFQIDMRSDGACRIDDLIRLIWWERWIHCSVEDLKTIENNDEKGRFVVDVNDGTIRCTQGHSIKTITDHHLRQIPLHLAEGFACWHGSGLSSWHWLCLLAWPRTGLNWPRTGLNWPRTGHELAMNWP